MAYKLGDLFIKYFFMPEKSTIEEARRDKREGKPVNTGNR